MRGINRNTIPPNYLYTHDFFSNETFSGVRTHETFIREPDVRSAVPKSLNPNDAKFFRFNVNEYCVVMLKAVLRPNCDKPERVRILDRQAVEVYVSLNNGKFYHRSPEKASHFDYLQKRGRQLEFIGYSPYYLLDFIGKPIILEDCLHKVDADGNCYIVRHRDGTEFTNIKDWNNFFPNR